MSKINIWGKDFNIQILYECKEGEIPTENQKQALEMLQEKINEKVVNEQGSNDIQHYLSSQKEIMTFIKSINDEEVNIEDSVLDYLKPVEMHILNEKERVIDIVCDFKLDMDHSVLIRFKNEKFDGFYQEEE